MKKVRVVEDPKFWKPVHDTIVTLHVLGRKNDEISKAVQLNYVTISNIIRCPAGQAKIKELNEIKQKALMESTVGKIQRIEEASISNIHDIVTKPEEFKGRPLALMELSTKALKAVGDFKTPVKKADDNVNNPIQNNQFNFFTTTENAERIVNGLNKLKEIATRKAV